jgi:nucleotide-binding universal stress UspA family protein
MGYRRVVVGTDGSETAAIAVRYAAQLARASGGELLIVTAFRPQPTGIEAEWAASGPAGLYEGSSSRIEDAVPQELQWQVTDASVAEAHAIAASQIAADQGVPLIKIHCIPAPGDPASALIAVAEERGADVIVVGSKGINKASRFLLGNVPNKVSHHAPCDVMIVHTAD